MEVSSFPFLNQEEISHFYALLQDMDNALTGKDNNNNNYNTTTTTTSSNATNTTTTKHRIKDNNNNTEKKDTMRDILASLLILEEEEKQESENWDLDFQQEKFQFDSNLKQQIQAMNNYYSNMINDQYEEDITESENSRTKRARLTATAAVAITATTQGGTQKGDTTSSSNTSSSQVAGPGRRLWVKDRSKDWWDRCNSPDFPDEEFKKAFRMSKSTFDMICDELDSAVTKKNTMLRDAIPVRQRVAVCIWRLATGEPLRLVSKRFGLGISTCHKLVLEVCSAIKTVLMPKFLQWPEEERLRFIKSEYEAVSGIPNVAGSMYTTHVPIIAPKISVAAYFNRRHTERNQKTSYSITVQGVVDPRGMFTDVCIGWPGSMQDDQVLEKSALYQRANRGLLKDVWIVGSRGFPLMDWVLVPYTHQNLTWTQHAFNEKIEEVQKVAKEAFMRLKARWSCLQKRTEVKLQDLPVVLGACCVLHNICELKNEELDLELRFDLFDDEMVPDNGLRSANAIQARDHIAHNLLHHGLLGSSFL